MMLLIKQLNGIMIASLEQGRLLLLVVHQKVKSKINLTPRQIKDQFNTYKDKYKKFHTKSISTGFGLTNEDQRGSLMGGRALINPWFKVDAQAENKTATSSPSEPAGNEIRSSEMESNNDYEEDVVISAIDKQAEKNLADETNKDDKGKGKKEEFQPSGQMNKQGRPPMNNNTTGIMLNEEKNASSPEIIPSNVILDTKKKNKKQKTRKHN
ncbi:hypothetical protein VP01_6070g1 [Puccinia sorghi]|uniref:Uncharacterized protein n=1 Tax=Puccinia sorghi TaxID=27349 RepID=A0A0L6UH90_9BASI|nr:hypothetical protein VP01_6070g1 [Puccinia sorghi]